MHISLYPLVMTPNDKWAKARACVHRVAGYKSRKLRENVGSENEPANYLC